MHDDFCLTPCNSAGARQSNAVLLQACFLMLGSADEGSGRPSWGSHLDDGLECLRAHVRACVSPEEAGPRLPPSHPIHEMIPFGSIALYSSQKFLFGLHRALFHLIFPTSQRSRQDKLCYAHFMDDNLLRRGWLAQVLELGKSQCMTCPLYVFFNYWILRERGKGRQIETLMHQHWSAASYTPPAGDWDQNLGMFWPGIEPGPPSAQEGIYQVFLVINLTNFTEHPVCQPAPGTPIHQLALLRAC